MGSSILIKCLPPYIMKWIRLTNERLSTSIETIVLPRLARALLTLIGLCRIYFMFKTKAGEFQALLDGCSSTHDWELLLEAKTQIYEQNTYRKWSWKVFISIKFTSSYLALKLGYINKTHAIYTKWSWKLYFSFVWLLQNCFLPSISRTWKTIEVSTFHASLVR